VGITPDGNKALDVTPFMVYKKYGKKHFTQGGHDEPPTLDDDLHDAV
jgi:hypothetical protein